MNVKEYLAELIQTKPKHYAIILRNQPDILSQLPCDDLPVAERVYRFLNPHQSTVCPLGKQYKFKSVTEGYINCGKASTCACTKTSVSKSVSTTKQKIPQETKQLSNKKRAQTNIVKYGVSNVGQTSQAKNKHKEFYNNEVNKINQVAKIKQTKLQRHGDASFNNIDKIKSTWNERKQHIFSERFPDKDIEILYDSEQMSLLYQNNSVEDIAKLLNVHVQTVYKHLNFHKIRTPFVSELEREMIEYLHSIGVDNIVKNSRKIISNELDIYLPDYRVAIEMNGIYWHHDTVPHINRYYHQKKFLECEQKNIQLLTVFSDLWDNKKEIIKNMIRHKLGASSQCRVYARQCTVRDVSTDDARIFLEQNHIQGNTRSSTRLGLYYNSNLVALMTFSEPRNGIGKNREKTVELVRYASSQIIVGGASKLISAFRKQFPEYKHIISYSDNEWSQGNMYKALGFDLETDHRPSYFYYHPKEKKRKHRYNFAKHKLIKQGFDPALTEYQIQQERGYIRIWDCGKRTWLMQL